jgi:methanogenic corrinoid protein MtbC1
MWENNLISVATEHLASAIVQTILNSQYHKVVHQKAQTNRRVVLACVENELHQIGITMASDIFELHAWNTYFLGVNVPTDELIEFIQTVKPNVLALTMSLEFHTPSLIQMLTQIRMNFPDLVIVLGGQAFENDQVQIPFIFKVAVLKTLDELDTFLSTSEA